MKISKAYRIIIFLLLCALSLWTGVEVGLVVSDKLNEKDIEAAYVISEPVIDRANFDFKGLNYDVDVSVYNIHDGVVEIVTTGNKKFIIGTDDIKLYSK